MRRVALTIIILALTTPSIADVTITISKDSNAVTIGYDCNEGEVVRAFALNIDVSNGAYVVGSAGFPGWRNGQSCRRPWPNLVSPMKWRGLA